MASPQIQPTSWWPSSTLPPPRSTTTTVAASASIQPPANMDAIIAIFQRLERRLDEQLAAASWPPRPNPDPPYGMPWDCQPSSSWDLPPARPVSSWDLPQSRLPYDQHAQRFPSSSSPDPDAYDPNLCSNPSYWNYSDPYAYDPPVGRPLTSWDLPRPRIESYGGGGSSPYMYGASRTHGDGGYAPSSYHGGGYSGGGYANESNSYAPPPPPPQVSCYVPAPQPNPPSRPQPQQPDGGYVLVPPSYTPPPHPWDSPCSLTTLNDVRFTTSIEREKERGVREMVEEEKKDTEVTENPIIEAETLSKTIVHRVEKDKRSQLSTDSEISVPRASFLASSKAFVAVANPGRCFSTVVKVSAAAQNELDKALDIKALVREPESRPSPNAHEKADSSSGDKNSGPNFGKIVDATGSGQQHRSGYWKTGSATKLLSLDPKKPLKESPIWIDSSITEQCNDSEKAVGDAMELSSLKGSRTDEKFTGLPIMRIVGTPQEAYKDMERISLVSSYMASLLMGSYAAVDHNDGAWMHLTDIKERAWMKQILEVTSPSNGSVKVLKFIFGLYDLAEVYKEFVSPP